MEAYNYVLRTYLFDNRYYHDIRHINKMLKNAFLYGNKQAFNMATGGLDDSLYYAILFHDVVYDTAPGAISSNEEQSVTVWEEYFDNWLCDSKHISLRDQVSAMIRATEHHFENIEYDDYVTNLFLDLDLLGFVDDYEDFKKTQQDIDLEFSCHYNWKNVREKRGEFLENIVANKLLKYRVVDPNGKLTEKAYENITLLLTTYY